MALRRLTVVTLAQSCGTAGEEGEQLQLPPGVRLRVGGEVVGSEAPTEAAAVAAGVAAAAVAGVAAAGLAEAQAVGAVGAGARRPACPSLRRRQRKRRRLGTPRPPLRAERIPGD